MVHVLIGTNKGDVDLFDKAIRSREKSISWVVPKQAAVGDDVIFYFWSRGFYARGKVSTPPKPGVFQSAPDKQPRNVKRAVISKLSRLASPVDREAVEHAVPEWGWIRMRFPVPTTPPSDVQSKLIGLIEGRAPTPADPPDSEAPLAEEVPPSVDVWEGALSQVRVNRYERNKRARQACIDHWGTRCVVCEFDFGRRYGEQFIGFIHVHHVVPISSIRRRYKLDPVKHLRPICPNCHAVLHRDPGIPLSVDEARSLLRPASRHPDAGDREVTPARAAAGRRQSSRAGRSRR